MPLRISPVWVVPMKMPSNRNDQTETRGEAITQGRKTAVAARTSSRLVNSPTSHSPAAKYPSVTRRERIKPQRAEAFTAATKRARERAP